MVPGGCQRVCGHHETALTRKKPVSTFWWQLPGTLRYEGRFACPSHAHNGDDGIIGATRVDISMALTCWTSLHTHWIISGVPIAISITFSHWQNDTTFKALCGRLEHATGTRKNFCGVLQQVKVNDQAYWSPAVLRNDLSPSEQHRSEVFTYQYEDNPSK